MVLTEASPPARSISLAIISLIPRYSLAAPAGQAVLVPVDAAEAIVGGELVADADQAVVLADSLLDLLRRHRPLAATASTASAFSLMLRGHGTTCSSSTRSWGTAMIHRSATSSRTPSWADQRHGLGAAGAARRRTAAGSSPAARRRRPRPASRRPARSRSAGCARTARRGCPARGRSVRCQGTAAARSSAGTAEPSRAAQPRTRARRAAPPRGRRARPRRGRAGPARSAGCAPWSPRTAGPARRAWPAATAYSRSLAMARWRSSSPANTSLIISGSGRSGRGAGGATAAPRRGRAAVRAPPVNSLCTTSLPSDLGRPRRFGGVGEPEQRQNVAQHQVPPAGHGEVGQPRRRPGVPRVAQARSSGIACHHARAGAGRPRSALSGQARSSAGVARCRSD